MNTNSYNLRKVLLTFSLISFVFNAVYAQWELESFNPKRVQFGMVNMGDSLAFIGGLTETGISDRIDFYDIPSSKMLSPMYLTESVSFPGVNFHQNVLLVAGGLLDFTSPLRGSNKVNIFENGIRVIDTLDETFFLARAVGAKGKIYLAGALKMYDSDEDTFDVSKYIHIYDIATKTWSKDSLSIKRTGVSMLTDGEIILIAGGWLKDHSVTDHVDIYHIQADSWSSAKLSQARMNMGAVYSNGSFYFGGGAEAGINNSSDVVDIYDGSTWSTAKLSEARGAPVAATAGDKVLFCGGGDLDLTNWVFTSSVSTADVYNTSTRNWSRDDMVYTKMNHNGIGVGNKVYIAGGAEIGSGSFIDVMEIWDVTASIDNPASVKWANVYPNPCQELLNFESSLFDQSVQSAEIYSESGQLLEKQNFANKSIHVGHLKNGLYILKIDTGKGPYYTKIHKCN